MSPVKLPILLAATLIFALSSVQAMEITRVSDNLHVSGQPTASEFTEFAARGGMHVIDLRPPSETPDFNEAAVVTRAGMAYYNIPIAGSRDLTRDNVELLDRVLAKVDRETTLLHCASANRVGALMALRARWLYDADYEEAITLGREHGMTTLQPDVERLLQSD